MVLKAAVSGIVCCDALWGCPGSAGNLPADYINPAAKTAKRYGLLSSAHSGRRADVLKQGG